MVGDGCRVKRYVQPGQRRFHGRLRPRSWGANNFQIGILAALPFISQIVQLPVILAVERFRRRKAMGLPAWLLANLMWLPIGAVLFLIDTPGPGAGRAGDRTTGAAGVVSSGVGDGLAQLDARPGATADHRQLIRPALGSNHCGRHRGRTERQLLRALVGGEVRSG